jgi:murein DD-endopeptidase MepM/ murein hydrolase activator NlpD
MNRIPIIDVIITFPGYIFTRINDVVEFGIGLLKNTLSAFLSTKVYLVSHLFWGRGSMYRNLFHFLITFISVVSLVTGVAAQLQPATAQGEFGAASGVDFDQDSLQQGASLQSVLPIDATQTGFQAGISRHTVAKGDTVKSIADKYKITPDTVRWANIKLIGPFSNYLEVGWELNIPQVNGILHEVKQGEKLDDIIARTKGNLFEVREINELQGPEYKIRPGQMLFIPSGNPYVWNGKLDDRMLREAFEDPLSHPDCAGYRYYGGFTGTHNGVDLAYTGGCPIRSVAPGIVKHAGWWGGGGGWTVIIDHGAGIETHYYHGNGQIWVKKGEFVSAGQNILFMGTTGNSSGVHLHFSIFRDGAAFDPQPYVPYKINTPY